MIFIYEVLYIKELDNINELFKNDCKIPIWFKSVICFFKRLFCILTIKDNKICILPYKKINNKFVINIITKIVCKLTKNVVLSNYLNDVKKINNQFCNKGIYIYKGNMLIHYLIYNFIDYISKLRQEETALQELFILVNNSSQINKDSIIYLAQKFKRINIVTLKLNNFMKLSDYLEGLGIAITVTNNKRKSLLKAKFIINLDFDENMINAFSVNTKAVIIETNKKVNLKSKLFNGINVLDFQMIYDNITNNFNDICYKNFDKKILYEQSLTGKNYENAIKDIEQNNVKIVNLIGKNGIINTKEYLKI